MSSFLIYIFIQYVFFFCKSQTIVTNQWNDDWLTDANGWSDAAIYNDNCGPATKYHGVWNSGGTITLQRTFICDNTTPNQRYWVFIEYGIAYDPCGDANTITVKIDSQTVATHKRLDGTGYYDTDECYNSIACSGSGNKASIQERSISPSSLNDITSNDPFLLTFSIANGNKYELAMFGINVTCNAKTLDPTSIPTTSIPTTYPSNIPTSNPTNIPTLDPTNHPTTDPTIELTTEPTSYPTFIPTSTPSKNPTTDPTINPTKTPSTSPTNIPTTNPTETGGEGGVKGTETTIQNTQSKRVTDRVVNGYSNEVYALGIVIILLIICVIVLCCIYYKKRKVQKRRDKVLNGNAAIGAELARVVSVSHSGVDTMIAATSTSTNMSTNNNGAAIAINSEPDVYSDHTALQMWLKNVDCMEYYDIFIEQGFGDQMQTLSTLTDNDLQGMGIDKMAHRKRILLQIQNMNMVNMMNNNQINIGLISDGPSGHLMNNINHNSNMYNGMMDAINTAGYDDDEQEDEEQQNNIDNDNDLYLPNNNGDIMTTKDGDITTTDSKGNDEDNEFMDDGDNDEGSAAAEDTDDDMYHKPFNQTNQ